MKKLNWGTGIALTITVFVIATLSVVSYMISLDFYLVSNNHYEEAEQFQETIDKRDNVRKLKAPVMVLFDEPTTSIKITFPDELLKKGNMPEGTLIFYRPNNSDSDRKVQLNLNENGIQRIPVGELSKGKWKLIMEWTSDSLAYRQEENILI